SNPDPLPLYPHPSHNGSAAATPAQQRHTVAINTAATPTAFNTAAHSGTQRLTKLSPAGSILDRAIEAEDRKHGDFLRLEHIEGYLELSAKTKSFFTTVVALWDADFYVKYSLLLWKA
ncbi:unnamed protein product, partial [Ilex paraguariensis]